MVLNLQLVPFTIKTVDLLSPVPDLNTAAMKIFMFFVNAVYWLHLFIVPVMVFSFAAFWIYAKDDSNMVYALLLVLAGILLGIFIAEKVRRKYGLSNFFGGMASTADADTENDHQ